MDALSVKGFLQIIIQDILFFHLDIHPVINRESGSRRDEPENP